ncbi:hypothetical protein NYZ99_00490 [Maribacter litopenaei]|uniref:Uncharacterized protein n=1 Tax=Maribacter litopenaei TaxID=2976127 RepID=A0ABY5Y9N6_9FLAO|nr:hypothetical protein [Maribacter litopenaei]UWX55155.1 hypothetical protein NYZ99_00490 [Maribacter litopenaei]
MKTTNTKWVLGHKVTPHDTTGNYDLMFAETPAGVQGHLPMCTILLKNHF